MASTKIKMRFPLFLLLGILFLASVSLCLGSVSHHREEDERRPWRPEHEREDERGQRERGRQEGEKEEDERQPWRHDREREEEEEEWRGSRRREDPDERERVRVRTERARKWRRESHEESEERDFPRRSERSRRHRESEQEEEEDEDEGSSSSSESSRSRRNNPFHFRSNRFQTRFENENGYIRLLQRFDERSNQFENLENYRILEYKAKPHTLALPYHSDADSIFLILSGKAIVTLVNPDDRDSYNLERGDALLHPAGTTAYVANRDDNENLRVVELLIPVNRPGQYQPFFPYSSESQESYFNGFSRNTLEAAFNADFEEIERVLLRRRDQGQQQRGEQSQEQGLIVKLSRDQIQELSRHAKSSSRRRASSSESEPFNLRSRNPIYSNKFGRLFEITPEQNPQLRDLDIFLSSAEIREGSLFLPHYHSRSTLILVVNEGKGNLELVAQRRRNQNRQRGEQDQDQQRIEAQRFNARLSPGDVVVVPASHPFAINASSDLNLVAFGINAENNQRNFLAGDDDNVISQIERPVKELAFPGSAEDVERLIRNQRNSHFANAQPDQQREEGGRGRRGPLSSILDAFY